MVDDAGGVWCFPFPVARKYFRVRRGANSLSCVVPFHAPIVSPLGWGNIAVIRRSRYIVRHSCPYGLPWQKDRSLRLVSGVGTDNRQPYIDEPSRRSRPHGSTQKPSRRHNSCCRPGTANYCPQSLEPAE